ncbi:MAG: lactate racemase domain-containing protein [Oscillospiraceae bacterium]|nr:lactate racemase domain-containing protein [Oscillospiraceae bacterium]
MILLEDEINGLSDEQIKSCLAKSISGRKLNRVLLIPPDITRPSSGAGKITSMYYDLLKNERDAKVDILPALGTHVPMTRAEQITFFGDIIPESSFLVHDWRNGVKKIGEVPSDFVYDVSDGLINEAMDIELSNYILDKSYDLILSIGQVVPHEVVGMANYTKNIVVGCGGSAFINKSHILGAFYGMERIMGRDFSPVRKVFDYAEQHYLTKLPIEYVLTVTVTKEAKTDILGLYISKNRDGFNKAVAMSQRFNIIKLDKPIQTCFVFLDEKECRSTWLGNKAIYRTRMAMANDGHLVVLAPGVEKFGEDEEIDRLIRKYGYVGRENILKLCKSNPELMGNLSAAAHLIHGSTDGRFNVTYATRHLGKNDIEGVGYDYLPYDEAIKECKQRKDVYIIDNPGLGLWMLQDL